MKWLGLMVLIGLSLIATPVAARETRIKHYGPEETQAMIKAMAPLVEAAVSRPMTELYARARNGREDDRLTYFLALSAGRDTSAIPDPANTPANAAKFIAEDAQWYASGIPLSATPTEVETDRWIRLIQRESWMCLPCRPFLSKDDGSSYAAWVRINDPEYWRRETSLGDGDRSMAIFGASNCVTGLAQSLNLDAMVRWLDIDLRTAKGRRAQLGRALREHVNFMRENSGNTSCVDDRYEDLRRILRDNRPELFAKVAAYLEVRLGDPRTPAGMG